MIAVLLVIGFVGAYFWQILTIICLVLLAKWAVEGVEVLREEQAGIAERERRLIARADRQHQQVMSGDEAGIYGAFPPTEVKQ